VIWPPGRKPALVTVYLTATSAPPDARNEAHAAVARLVAQALTR
jgi:hypothetical protein